MILRYGNETEDCTQRKIISNPKNIKEAYRSVHADLNKKGFKWGRDYQYFTTTVFETYLRIDFGSLKDFYYLEELKPEWKAEWNEYTETENTKCKKFT